MKILVTGGAGYIGSHTCVDLLHHGYEVIVADNFDNSKPEVIDRIHALTGRRVTLYPIDVCQKEAVKDLFFKEKIDGVIHFAGHKAVGESVQNPLKYYANNLRSTMTVLEVMRESGVNHFVFSSSATVYGTPDVPKMTEEFPFRDTSPYGTTKQMSERILMDLAKADSSFHPVILRYFNPVGAHESGRIGEDPNGIPNNLMPYLSQVAIGKLEKLHVFGNDYDTPDGTGVRDYIHVVDLAAGHVAALKKLETKGGLQIYNLGTGIPYSVLDVLHAFEKAVGRTLPYQFAPRRPGDIACYYADPAKAEKELGWKAQKTLDDMCLDTWRWQTQNPHGYEE